MKKLYLILSLALILCFVVGCQDKVAMAELEEFRAQAAVEEQNKEIALKFVEALKEGNYDIHDELFSEDYKAQYGSYTVTETDLQRRMFQEFYKAFPNYKYEIEHVITKNDTVVIRLINWATHEGEYKDIPATGEQVDYQEMWIFHIADGKIRYSWGIKDFISIWLQLQFNKEYFGMELKPKEEK